MLGVPPTTESEAKPAAAEGQSEDKNKALDDLLNDLVSGIE